MISASSDLPNLTVVDHPLLRHKLSLMRDRDTSTSKFRQLMREISHLLAYEATRGLALEETEIETPLERGVFPVLAGKKLCLVSILRAGNGFLDGMLDLVPSARVGHIGIYRDPRTLQAIEYYLKLPEDLPRARCDPGRPDAGDRQFGGRRDLPVGRAPARARSSSSASSPRLRGWLRCSGCSRRCRSSRRRSTAASTSTAISCQGSAMQATGFTAHGSRPPDTAVDRRRPVGLRVLSVAELTFPLMIQTK